MKRMSKHWTLGLFAAAAISFSLPAIASAHESHGGGWHGHHGRAYRHGHFYGHGAAFVPVPVAVPRPIVYVPRPVVVAAPVYAAPVYAPPAFVPVPFISVRTRNVAVSIGGVFPY
jgi:hypothetical protein